ncbi:preprotein translocase subunit YajC [Paludibacterium paludis]|uniref:Sec translocon accessory complex subunit YajC n=1 Tax=Paludibacterium paludis TaxID=1225769 RepID=A0A918P165_9NEIS|nr:preprotein translocase subunit YajC [Paludibacterium paludis]GGY11495.1 preprotein translocase subunit YajC [Paludibacterium paludis]
MFISPAYANTAAPGGFDIMSILPMVAIFALFWFLMIRPQQKKMKEHQAMLAAIVKGDEVVTQGGIAGRVSAVGENFLTVEIAQGIEIKVQKAAVTAKLEKGSLKSL